MPNPPRRLGAAFEQLEDRSLPSAFGVPWADPGHMTLSFVPDGTPTPTGPSSLFQTMSTAGPPAVWENEILRAFQTWAVNANINIGLVADGGQALGAVGAVQGDARFGDIRIAAAPISSTEAAAASPFSWSGTTFAGDVTFSDAAPFRIGNVANAYDVFTVALHEAGHVFGLDHSTATGSALNESYGYRTGLAASDIANLQALYGPRTADAFEGSAGNGTLATASVVPKDKITGSLFTADADLTTTSDADFFQFKAASASVTVSLQAQGLSLLQSRVSVYDAAGTLVASGTAQDAFNNDVTLEIANLRKNGTYFVKVESATADVFGVGSYRVTVDTDKDHKAKPLTAPPVTDAHSNDTLAHATDLTTASKIAIVGAGDFDLQYRGAIEDGTDTDFYKIHAPAATSGTTVTLNVIVWATDGALNPRVRVFDAKGQPVAFQVLANSAGVMSVVVPNAPANVNYFIQVSARTPGGANGAGGYFLGADFNQSTVAVAQEIGGGTLDSLAPTSTAALQVNDGGIYQFALSADPSSAGIGDVTLTVTDAGGKVVFVLDAQAGQPAVTVAQFLATGTYTFNYSYSSVSGAVATSVRYHVAQLKLSEGIGTYAPSLGLSPPPPPAAPTSPTTYIAPLPPPLRGLWYFF